VECDLDIRVPVHLDDISPLLVNDKASLVLVGIIVPAVLHATCYQSHVLTQKHRVSNSPCAQGKSSEALDEGKEEEEEMVNKLFIGGGGKSVVLYKCV